MSKFDHRLKRLEQKTGIVKHEFEYWFFSHYGKDEAAVEKEIGDIKAGKIPGKMTGAKWDPLNPQQRIIIGACPRPDTQKLKEKKPLPVLGEVKTDPRDLTDEELDREIASARKDPRDLTDEELEAEIRNAQQEIDNANITGTT